MSTGRDNNFWKHGWFAGYKEWRYGASRHSSSPAAILTGSQRRSVKTQVRRVLRNWNHSPFEHEAPIRHGLRAALCLEGYEWKRADAEAAAIVADVLSSLHAKRPSWDEGQRQYTIPREDCNWCGGPLDAEDMVTRAKRFCSVECARSAVFYRDYEAHRAQDETARAALGILRRNATTARTCAQCERPFKPFTEDSAQRFCCDECSNKSKIKETRKCGNPRCRRTFLPLTTGNVHFCSARCRQAVGHNLTSRTVRCEQCNRDFTSSRKDARFCGGRCRDQHRADREAIAAGRPPRRADDTIVRTCRFCGSPFEARSYRADYCTVGCRTMAQGFRTGGWIPKTISPPLFDHITRMAA